MGKKQTCPYCKEKVDLKRMFPSPYPLLIISLYLIYDICHDGGKLFYMLP